MRLTKKKVEEIIHQILGDEGMPLVKQLHERQNVSEFDLANKTKKDIKVIRRLLYILYNYNLVGFTRKKDKQKGWYIYYWTLLPDSIRFLYYKKKKALLDRLEKILEEEGKELFFVCPNNCVRLNFDQGMDFEFHCPECGELITQDSNDKKIVELKKKIKNLKEELREAAVQRKPIIRIVKKSKKKITKTTKKVRKKKVVKKGIKKKGKKKAVKRKAQKKVVKKLSKKKNSKKNIKKKQKSAKKKF